LCVQGEVGRESMVVGSGDGLCTGYSSTMVYVYNISKTT
jgi:hypothetical protein